MVRVCVRFIFVCRVGVHTTGVCCGARTTSGKVRDMRCVRVCANPSRVCVYGIHKEMNTSPTVRFTTEKGLSRRVAFIDGVRFIEAIRKPRAQRKPRSEYMTAYRRRRRQEFRDLKKKMAEINAEKKRQTLSPLIEGDTTLSPLIEGDTTAVL